MPKCIQIIKKNNVSYFNEHTLEMAIMELLERQGYEHKMVRQFTKSFGSSAEGRRTDVFFEYRVNNFGL